MLRSVHPPPIDNRGRHLPAWPSIFTCKLGCCEDEVGRGGEVADESPEQLAGVGNR